jgi:hypothetical protein
LITKGILVPLGNLRFTFGKQVHQLEVEDLGSFVLFRNFAEIFVSHLDFQKSGIISETRLWL